MESQFLCGVAKMNAQLNRDSIQWNLDSMERIFWNKKGVNPM